jgi:hypothetical protein
MARCLPPVLLVFSLVVAQPQGQVLWSHHATDGVCATTMIEDLDGDSISEVVGLIHWGRYLTNELRLYDAIGCQVGRPVRGVGSDQAGRLRLDDIASLASGAYFADLTLEDGRRASVKLIRLSSNKR